MAISMLWDYSLAHSSVLYWQHTLTIRYVIALHVLWTCKRCRTDAQVPYFLPPQVNKVGLKVRGALITEVYRKSLSVSLATMSRYSTGQVRPCTCRCINGSTLSQLVQCTCTCRTSCSELCVCVSHLGQFICLWKYCIGCAMLCHILYCCVCYNVHVSGWHVCTFVGG